MGRWVEKRVREGGHKEGNGMRMLLKDTIKWLELKNVWRRADWEESEHYKTMTQKKKLGLRREGGGNNTTWVFLLGMPLRSSSSCQEVDSDRG